MDTGRSTSFNLLAKMKNVFFPICLSSSLSLPSLLLKVCEILRSRSQDARGAARDTLVKMAAALGPAFLPYIFKEMKDLLTRGYQVAFSRKFLHRRTVFIHKIMCV